MPQNSDSSYQIYFQKDPTDGYKIVPNSSGQTQEPPADSPPERSEYEIVEEAFAEFTDVVTDTGNNCITLGALVENANGKIIADQMLPLAKKLGTPIPPIDDYGDAFELSELNFEELREQLGKIADTANARDALYPMLLMSVVAHYDALVSKLIEAFYDRAPEALDSSEKAFTYSELKRLGSIDEARRSLIDREIDSVMFGSHVDQIRWLEKRLRIPFLEKMPDIADFCDIFEIRNLCAHGSHTVTQRYIDSRKKYGIVNDREMGDAIVLNHEYVIGSIKIILRYGSLLAQYVWRNLYKKDNKAVEAADESLIELGKMLVLSSQEDEAQVIFEWGYQNFSPANERMKRELIISHARCYIREQAGRARDILSGHDWTASDPALRVRVCAMTGNFEMAAELIKTIGSDGSLTLEDYANDPEFDDFRKSPYFDAALTEVFGAAQMVSESDQFIKEMDLSGDR